MRYTVIASPAAQGQLALIWMQATDQQAVADASDEIDRILRTAPLTSGEDQGGQRILTVDPLSAVYTVSPDDCLVEIVQYIYHG